MLKAIAIWLTISTPLCPAPALATDLVDDLIPPVPPWPSGLSRPERTADGVLLRPDLGQAVHGRLLYLDAYPGLCRTALEQQQRALGVQYQGELAVQAAQATAASDKRAASAEAHRLTLGKVLGIGVVSAALGALAVLIAEHH